MSYDRCHGVEKIKQRLKIGDWVRSKAGPVMTVFEIDAAGARCRWLNGTRLESGWFHPSDLELSHANAELNQSTNGRIIGLLASLHSSRQAAEGLRRALLNIEKQYANSNEPAFLELRRIVLLQIAALYVDQARVHDRSEDRERTA